MLPTRAAAGSTLSWRNLVPKAVDVDGDLALVYFEVDWSFETAAGERGENSRRRLLVLRRVDGQWRIAGGTVAAVR